MGKYSKELLDPLFNVFIAGHSEKRLIRGFSETNEESILKSVREKTGEMLDLINSEAKELFKHKIYKSSFDDNETKDIYCTIITGLDDGVDQIARHLSSEQRYPLSLVVPQIPSTSYSLEKSTKATRLQQIVALDKNLDHKEIIQEDLLITRNEIAINLSDLLIVVWDGTVLQGNDDDTVQILKQALARRKPILWIKPGDISEVRINFLDKLTNRYLFELESTDISEDFLKQVFCPIGDTEKHLKEWITRLISPPPCSNRELSSSLKNSISNSSTDEIQKSHDELALKYSKRHHSFSALVYYLAASAVFFAVAGAIHLWPYNYFHSIWVIFEAVTIIAIMAIVYCAKKLDWHGKWLSNRFLCEQIRYHKTGQRQLVFSPVMSMPLWGVTRDGKINLASEDVWLLHRILAPKCIADITEQDKRDGTDLDKKTYILTQNFFKEIETLLSEIDAQINYHKNNAEKKKKEHERIHKISERLFAITFACVIAHFVIHPSWLLFGTAFLPALGAAFHGIVTQKELNRTKLLSTETLDHLIDLKDAITNCITKANRDESNSAFRTIQKIRHLTNQSIIVMSADAEQWRKLLHLNGANLPA